jgi:hypothetical protein
MSQNDVHFNVAASQKMTSRKAVNATNWFIDDKRFARDWAKAQALVGLPVDAQEEKRYSQVVNWNRHCATVKDYRFKDLNYIPIAKVASEEIFANLRVWREKKNSASNNCSFAFVRDPLARFVSGYVEFEWRFVEAKRQKVGIVSPWNYTFDRHAVGTAARAKAFIKDILSFQVLDWIKEGIPRRVSWFAEHIDEAPFLFHRVAISHICPMVGALRGKDIDFVGKLESFSQDWEMLSEQCEVHGLGSFNETLAGHITSQDPQKTKKAMMQALDEDCKLKTAVCLLFKSDYDMLSSHFNYTCRGCGNSVVAPTV